MGWTSEYFDGTMKEYQDYVLNSYLTPHKLVAYNRKGNNLFCAVDNGTLVYGLVILCTKNKGEYSCKLMDETAHPYYYGASTKVLNLLTETDSKNALTWRKECGELIDQQKEKGYYLITCTHVSGSVMYLGYSGIRYKKETRNRIHTLDQGKKTVESCTGNNPDWNFEIIVHE